MRRYAKLAPSRNYHLAFLSQISSLGRLGGADLAMQLEAAVCEGLKLDQGGGFQSFWEAWELTRMTLKEGARSHKGSI